MTARKGDWMETASGRQVYPLDIRPEDVTPHDVAHGLSMTCRYGGHTTRFYSVAEHCVILSDYAWTRYHGAALALDMLTHDAAEAFLGDIPRPLKRQLPPWWKDIEKAADAACATALGARYPFLPIVKELDNRILLDERAQIMSPSANWWGALDGVERLGVNIYGWEPHIAKKAWLKSFEFYTAIIKETNRAR